jgi:hypothetical protein
VDEPGHHRSGGPAAGGCRLCLTPIIGPCRR